MVQVCHSPARVCAHAYVCISALGACMRTELPEGVGRVMWAGVAVQKCVRWAQPGAREGGQHSRWWPACSCV